MFHPDDPDYQDHKNEPENIDSELEVIHSLARVMIFDVKNSLSHFEHFEVIQRKLYHTSCSILRIIICVIVRAIWNLHQAQLSKKIQIIMNASK